MPSSKFIFEGFLPKKQSERNKILHNISKSIKTTILFESPHRLKKLLNELNNNKDLNLDKIKKLNKEKDELYKKIYSNLDAWKKVQIWQSGIVLAFSFATRERRERGRRGGEGGGRRRKRKEERKGGEGSLAATRRASSLVWFIVGDDSLGWLID